MSEIIKVDLSAPKQEFKPMNATNGGPWHRRHQVSMPRSNFEAYRAARIPYARNHDSGLVPIYGGPYAHDITKIFRNFDADENDPASYDFGCTDEALLTMLDAGTKPFFRLGESAEVHVVPHALIPPKDFHKWARICEHVIRHYTEGWANGFSLDMEYWEIWNEPDLHCDDVTKGYWLDVEETFYDFYEIAAKHLKSCFPHLKIGGPSVSNGREWSVRFLSEMQKREVPIDFFSWHVYATRPEKCVEKAAYYKGVLARFGYENAESICNEWNYVAAWDHRFIESVRAIHGIRGAAFMMSVISEAQASDDIDMMMYYDTRPQALCGAFDFYTYEPLKGYYPLLWFGQMYDLKYLPVDNHPEEIYPLCGIDENGKITCILTYYTNNENATERQISLDFGREVQFEVTLLDEEHTATSEGVTTATELSMKPLSCILLKEI